SARLTNIVKAWNDIESEPRMSSTTAYFESIHRLAAAILAMLAALAPLPAAVAAVAAEEGQQQATPSSQPSAPPMTLEQRLRAQALRPENFSDIVQRMTEISYTRWVSRGEPDQPFVKVDRHVGQMRYEISGSSYTMDDLFNRILSTGMVVLYE